MNDSNAFYDDLAHFYHLIFEDWDKSLEKQADILSSLLPSPDVTGPILDCACGIGTQLLGLKKRGFHIEGSDLSPEEVKRAQKEAAQRGLSMPIRVDDMRVLETAPHNTYGAILLMDNALPHLLSDTDIKTALTTIKERLKENGLVILSVRDYEPLLQNRPTVTDPIFFKNIKEERFVHQVWDWINEREYLVHLYITLKTNERWRAHHFTGRYRAITITSLSNIIEACGLCEVKVLPPSETGYHQPIITAMKRH